MERPWKPTADQLAQAAGKTIPDVIAPGLRVLFCGINPGLYSAAIGHHFGRPGNRFWLALCLSGFTERVLSAFEDQTLLDLGLGITNLVARASARAEELSDQELRSGAAVLRRKVGRYRPALLAVLGVGAYRVAFDRAKAQVGLQDQCIGLTRVWVLPNPSGLNAHYQAAELGLMFAELRQAVDEAGRSRSPRH